MTWPLATMTEVIFAELFPHLSRLCHVMLSEPFHSFENLEKFSNFELAFSGLIIRHVRTSPYVQILDNLLSAVSSQFGIPLAMKGSSFCPVFNIIPEKIVLIVNGMQGMKIYYNRD